MNLDSPREAAAPAARPRVFLSYGRSDAAALVERLCIDLAAAGFDVWRDTREIRAGQDWQAEIVDGLRSAQVVVAVMTPHSVRTSPTAADAVDSVCLGEIAYALFHPPPRPVVPDMAQTCEPPLALFHLDYIDLRAWKDSESQYQAGLQRLIDAVEAALRGEKRYRAWEARLSPFDFASFLHAKRRDFCGRQWLFDRIDAWRASGRERALLIKGDPGVGKSALVAELVHRNPDGQVLAYHCCQWNYGETLKPARFVQSLAAMIAARLEAYAHLLQHEPAVRDALDAARCEADPASALEEGILAPLERLPAPDGGPRYILLDALDEALHVAPGAGTIVHLLAGRLDRWPAWLRLVATTRNDPLVLARLAGLQAEQIDAQSPDNLDDVRQFLDQRLATPDFCELLTHARLDAAGFRDLLLTGSEGNFLYVRQALDALALGQLDPRRLDRLPPGMAGLYQNRFEKQFPTEADFAAPKRVFEVLAAAAEPLSMPQLAAATELDVEEVLPAVLKRLAAYVPERTDAAGQPCHTFYHKSLSDWLTDPDHRGLPYSIHPKSGHRRLADVCWTEYTRGVSRLSTYALRHLPAHLLNAERWDDAARLLTDLDYLEAKTAAGRVFALAADLTNAAGSLPSDHPKQCLFSLLEEALRRDIHFIARHADDYPQALLQCLWNTGWWLSCPEGAAHYVAGGLRSTPAASAGNQDRELSGLLESWLVQAFCSRYWIRSLRPPPMRLGTPELAVLRGHERGVRSVSYSPDGRRIASGSSDKTVRVWDAASRAEVAVLRGHKDAVTSVSYSPDGRRIASASYDHTVRVWDADSGEELAMLRGHEFAVMSVSYSPDGRRIASGSSDKTARVWDANSGVELAVLRGHEEFVTSVSYSSDGQRIASGSYDKTVRVWNADSGAALTVLRGHDGSVNSVSHSPDGRRIASGSSDKTVRVWDAASGAELAVLRGHEDAVTSVSYSPNGRRIASASEDKTVRVWDAASGAELAVLRGHDDSVHGVWYSADGRQITSKSHYVHDIEVTYATVRVWDARSFALLGGFSDRTSMAAGAPHFPWRAVARGLETEVEEAGTCQVVARFPLRLQNIATHASSRQWAGSSGNQLYILSLEGPGAPSVVKPGREGWWTRRFRSLLLRFLPAWKGRHK